MHSLQRSWIREVRQSQIAILPDNESYIKGTDVKVWDVVSSLASGLSEHQLMGRHPALTKADIRACSLFVYLRDVGQI